MVKIPESQCRVTLERCAHAKKCVRTVCARTVRRRYQKARNNGDLESATAENHDAVYRHRMRMSESAKKFSYALQRAQKLTFPRIRVAEKLKSCPARKPKGCKNFKWVCVSDGSVQLGRPICFRRGHSDCKNQDMLILSRPAHEVAKDKRLSLFFAVPTSHVLEPVNYPHLDQMLASREY